jgi:hypothetical protein
MHHSSGILRYSNDPIKLVVQVDRGISDLYRSLIPRYLHVSRPMYDAHISVVRNVEPPRMDVWGKYEGQAVSFDYEAYIFNDELYYWLNVYSVELEAIRAELGLAPYGDVSLSPDGRHRFHITLGNLKNSVGA